MKKNIDCLLIGHNEMSFSLHEKTVARMGLNSAAYRDLSLNFIRYNNKPYTISDTFNLLFAKSNPEGCFPPLKMGETFSYTIAYLGSYLNKHGFCFDYINDFQEEKSKLAEILEKNNILTIAIITTLYITPFPIIEIIDFIRQYNQTAKIIVGGPFISTLARTMSPDLLEHLLKHTIKADIYVNSPQGEASLVGILNSLKSKSLPDNVPNIYYKIGDRLESTPEKAENTALSENPVNWDLFSPDAGEFISIRTAISCPFSCAFCGFPQRTGKYQTAEVEFIKKEMDTLDKIGKVKCLNFIDDTLNVPPHRFKEILRMMIKQGYQYKWNSYFRCQYADNEMVGLMKESGCDGVFLGIESGSQQILKNMNKQVNIEKYFQGIELLKKNGIVTFGNFIIGFPGENHETLQDTIRFIKDSGLDFFRVQLWYCEPITPIWEQREKYGIIGDNFEWSHSTMNSKTACDLVDEIFLTTEYPTWIPLYNFDFFHLWHLVHRGLNLKQVRDFLNAFNQGVKEKLRNPLQKDVDINVIKQMKKACLGNDYTAYSSNKKQNLLEKYDVDFDYRKN